MFVTQYRSSEVGLEVVAINMRFWDKTGSRDRTESREDLSGRVLGEDWWVQELEDIGRVMAESSTAA